MNNHRPWPNGLTEPGILDEPLDDPALQRDSARALLDEVVEAVERVGDGATVVAVRRVLARDKR